MTDRPTPGVIEQDFEGHGGRDCGEHRITGGRAWCFEDSEWCYPDLPCRGCELPKLQAAAAAVVKQWRLFYDATEPPLSSDVSDAVADLEDVLAYRYPSGASAGGA